MRSGVGASCRVTYGALAQTEPHNCAVGTETMSEASAETADGICEAIQNLVVTISTTGWRSWRCGAFAKWLARTG